jgi:hypothetical protein
MKYVFARGWQPAPGYERPTRLGSSHDTVSFCRRKSWLWMLSTFSVIRLTKLEATLSHDAERSPDVTSWGGIFAITLIRLFRFVEILWRVFRNFVAPLFWTEVRRSSMLRVGSVRAMTSPNHNF